jgi:hypothetical protein
MASIINFRRDPHRETQELLPWYVTGRLDEADRAVVEAHLADCAECSEELAMERMLASGVATLSSDADVGWARLRQTMAEKPAKEGAVARARRTIGRSLARPGRFGWLLTGQVALAAVVAVMLIPRGETGPYHTLASSAARPQGNVIILFRPDTSEETLRRTLTASGARLVDGPTAGGAYVIAVPPAQRNAVLGMLQSRPDVVLAQPLDGARGQ